MSQRERSVKMNDGAREFGLYIDGLRLERDISREDLCEGIMSLSQYKRYLRGETSIPNGKLISIADRLKFSINDIHFLFSKKHDNQKNKVLRLYNLVKEQKVREAYELGRELGKDVFLSDHTAQMFDFCMLLIQHSLNMVSDVHVLELYSKLIDYPNCIHKTSFNTVELSTLIQIVDLSAKSDNYEAANFLYQILSKDSFDFTSTDGSDYLPSVYSNISKILGMQDDYSKVLDVTNKGIKYCLDNCRTNSLSHLYFYNALALLILNKKTKALISAKKCFMLLFIECKDAKFDSFKVLFEQRFKMKLEDLIDFEK